MQFCYVGLQEAVPKLSQEIKKFWGHKFRGLSRAQPLWPLTKPIWPIDGLWSLIFVSEAYSLEVSYKWWNHPKTEMSIYNTYIYIYDMCFLRYTNIRTYVDRFTDTYIRTYVTVCMHTLHYITLHHIPLHYTTLYYITTFTCKHIWHYILPSPDGVSGVSSLMLHSKWSKFFSQTAAWTGKAGSFAKDASEIQLTKQLVVQLVHNKSPIKLG